MLRALGRGGFQTRPYQKSKANKKPDLICFSRQIVLYCNGFRFESPHSPFFKGNF
jgi:hypothetical protein